ncbi:hypothetical protein PST88_20245, partial [Yersinia pestis]|nr:hypothetical protein [Yersinia pestis]
LPRGCQGRPWGLPRGCQGRPWGFQRGCQGRPWGLPRGCQGTPWGLPRGCQGKPRGCEGKPWGMSAGLSRHGSWAPSCCLTRPTPFAGARRAPILDKSLLVTSARKSWKVMWFEGEGRIEATQG